ncbi:hypothetical protein PRIPAC_73759 [Pristionchus pacificus]|uniref:Inhibitor of growth protein n=1 Tax=Pristionchus pacificus TaxID=54126 RepID=A0A8R1V349_PRIPA|nr:hypothetical protein PRIPAC_73759 [Pristionchus pacificus]
MPMDTFYDKFMKSTNKILDRDDKYNSALKNVDTNIRGFMQNSKKMSAADKRRCIAEMEKMYDNADKLVMEKMGIIEALDKSIVVDRQELIDNNRQYFEGIADDELMITDPYTSLYKEKTKKCLTVKPKKTISEKPRKSLAQKAAEKVKRKRVDAPEDIIYCTCRRIEFGEMIQCDNGKCKIGWYHFTCVEMTQGPDDTVKWFCERCRPRFKDVPNQWNYETNEPPNVSTSRMTRK